ENNGRDVGRNAVRHWLRRWGAAGTRGAGKYCPKWNESRMKPQTNQKQTTFTDVAALEERYQLATYKKMPIVAERGEGVWIYTSDGEKYLDLYGGHAVAG